MNAGRHWVLLSALIVAVPTAALSQVQQSAPPAGMLNSNAAPAAVAEWRTGIDDTWMLAFTSACERFGRAVQLDSTFGLARAWRANCVGGPTTAAEAQRAAHDGLNASGTEAILTLAYREFTAGRGPNGRGLLTLASQALPNDRQIAMWRAVNMTDTARHNALREINARNPDFAAGRIQLALGLVNWSFTITEDTKANGDEALRVAEEAVRLAPQASGSHMVMGHVLHSLGRDADATAHLVAATKLTPVSWIAWDALADIYGRDGKLAEQRAALDSGIKYAPNIASKAFGRRVRALTFLSEGDGRKAMDEFTVLVKDLEAIDARGPLLTTHQWMALTSAGMRDSAGAEAHFSASRAYNPTPGNLADNGILVNSLIGNTAAARAHLAEYVRLANQAQNLTPEGMRTRDENVHRMTGAVLYAEKKYAEALAELKQGGLNPYVTLFTIECHKAMKNNKEADATRAAFLARREFTGNSTATAIIRYRAKK